MCSLFVRVRACVRVCARVRVIKSKHQKKKWENKQAAQLV